MLKTLYISSSSACFEWKNENPYYAESEYTIYLNEKEALTQAFYKLSEKMYQQANPQGAQGFNPNDFAGAQGGFNPDDFNQGGANDGYTDAGYTDANFTDAN